MKPAHIGCSGFSYPGWRGSFYPEGLPQKKWLDYYSGVFSTVEINATFYRLPKPETFEHWRDTTSPRFIFSVKGSRFITHIKRLSDPEEPLRLFFEGARRLREKLGVVLWQFSPGFGLDKKRLAVFLKLLRKYKARNAFEFRNETWISKEVIELCTDHNACLCMADWPVFLDDLPLTADFVYIRRHGRGGDYATSYTTAELRKDAARARGYMNKDREVFVYFNNDAYGYAPENAQTLLGLLQQTNPLSPRE